MRRRPWLAAVLSALLPGLGQVYNRQVGKAALFFVSYALPLAISSRLGPVLWEAIGQGRELAAGSTPFWTIFILRGTVMAIAIVVLIVAAVDAYRTARQG